MTIQGDMDSRSRLIEEWEDMCQQFNGNTFPEHNYGQGDINIWIIELNNAETRQQSIENLCKFRQSVPDMGPLIWCSFGAISSLIQEVLKAYLKPELSPQESARVYDALCLLECVAEHPRTKINFICSSLHEIISPLAKQRMTTQASEALRRASLRIIYALLKTENSDRRMIPNREQSCILVQLMTDNFLMPIIWSTTKFGQLPSLFLVIQIIERLFVYEDVLALFLQLPNNLKCLAFVVNHLYTVCQAVAPSLCSMLNGCSVKLEKYLRKYLATIPPGTGYAIQQTQQQSPKDIRPKNSRMLSDVCW